jgi:hypothetical protein
MPPKHFVPEALLGQLLNDKDEFQNCFHQFISSVENGTEDQVSYICRHCLKHLDLFPIESQKGQNDPTQCKKHYYYTTDSNSSSCTQIFEAHCVHCRQGWMINITRQVGPSELFKIFMFNKDIGVQVNILLMFIFYLGNLVHGDKKPINSANQKFQTFIGLGETSLALMDTFGYVLVGTFFQPKPTLNLPQLKRMLEELSLRKDILSNGMTSNSIFKFSEATFSLAKQLGANVPFQQLPKDFLVSFADTVKNSVGPYYILGALANTPDNDLIDCFKYLKAYDHFSLPRTLDAITDIAISRKSASLEEFVLTIRSNGMVGERELTAAYNTFGYGLGDDVQSKQIIDVYRYLCTVSPNKMDELMGALRIVAWHRDCILMTNFLSTGDILFEEQSQNTLPAGLNNIGNTCYMNSLLQYYFSINDLREYVLAAHHIQHETDDTAEDKKTLEFVSLMKKLFMQLIWSDSISVTPEKKLAEIILSNSNGDAFQFGEQQDLHECMDNVLDMFEVALKKCIDTDELGCSQAMLQQ